MTTLFLIAPQDQKRPILKPNLVAQIKGTGCSNVVIFRVQPKDCFPKLATELKELSLEVSDPVVLKSLTTEGLSNESDLKAIPWEILKEIVSAASEVISPIFVLGTGTRLHSHLMWMAALYLDARMMPFYAEQEMWYNNPRNQESVLSTDIAQDTLAAFLTLKSEAITQGSSETQWFGAQELASVGGAIRAGVNAALQTAISSGLVEKKDAGDRVVYCLAQKGWPLALKSWIDNRHDNEDSNIAKKLVITFGRLESDTTDESTGQGSRKRLEMIQYLRTLQPYDGFIAVLQLHDDNFKGTKVMKLEKALEYFATSKFIGDLQYVSEVLQRRTEEEITDAGNHLFVINPKASHETDQLLFDELWASIMEYEKLYKPHNWTVDITSLLSPLLTTASMFAYMSCSEISYLMKSRRSNDTPSGVAVVDSPFSIIDHRLVVPGKLALEVMGNIKGIKGTRRNILIAMLLHEDLGSPETERLKSKDSTIPADIFDILDDDIENTDPEGVSWNDLVSFVKKCKTPDSSMGLGNKSRDLNPLISSNFVTVVGSTDSGAAMFALTSSGRFVATWLKRQFPLEMGA